MKSELDYYEFFRKRFNDLRNLNNNVKIEPLELIETSQLSLIDSNEIREPISAGKFRLYLLKTVQRIENADIDCVYRMMNIRELGQQRFSNAFEQIYGDLNELDEVEQETELQPEQCREIITKLNLAKKRISFLKKSQFLRKKSFFKPVFYHDENAVANDNNLKSCNNSIFSSINSKKGSVSQHSSNCDVKSNELSNSNINHELSSKEFDNQHTELISWKEFTNLKKNLNHLQNEITIISTNFLNELK